jgi:hypothetical protein
MPHWKLSASFTSRQCTARQACPPSKTDIGDARALTRAGLLRGSFVPPAKLRELRLISRQRQKLVGQLSAEKTVYTNY